MLDPRTIFYAHKNISIDRPIFILGNQGDGLTLLSRMLRRNKAVVSATGNYKYWSGASEMQNVFEAILPRQLGGLRLKAVSHPQLTPPRSWSYACDALIDKYRATEADANRFDQKKMKHIIKICLGKHGKKISGPLRFVDKSQVYTVKMAFIESLLQDSFPYFILVTRNPYVSIYRAAQGKAIDMSNYSKFMSLEARLQLCIEHWLNSARCIEEDKHRVHHFTQIRFEDLLKEPDATMKRVCNFIDLEFFEDMLPQPHHKLPLGTKFEERWYPLRTDVNAPYLASIPADYVHRIETSCGAIAREYGYERPQG